MARLTDAFDTDHAYGALPRSNLVNDETTRTNQLKRTPITEGHIASVWPNERILDANIGTGSAICNIASNYVHWFSGGEYTLPYSGTRSIFYSEKGKGTLLGQIPSDNTKSYYRIAYTDPILKDIEPNRPSIFSNYRGGQPLDVLHGDKGYLSIDGYSYGILAGGPLYLRANPLAQIELFDLDSSIRMSSLNYEHITSQGFQKLFYNPLKGITDFREYGSIKGGPDDPHSVFDYFHHRGSVGNLDTFYIRDSYLSNLTPDGASYTKTKKDLLLLQGTIPALRGIVPNTDPNSLKEDDIEVEPIDKFDWAEQGRLSQEAFFLKTQKIYYNTFTEQDEDQQSTDAGLHVRDDGSLILISKAGSAIEMTSDGDIIISPRRHTQIRSGKDTTVLSGGRLNLLSRKDTTIRSTDQSINLLGLNRIQGYTEQGPILLETDSQDGIVSNSLVGKNQINSRNIFRDASVRIGDRSNIYVNRTLSFEVQARQGIQEYDRLDILTQFQNIQVSKTLNIDSDQLFWSGRSFIFNASAGGALNAPTPIRVNHVHQEGVDIFGFRRCGEGCTVNRIETPPLSLQRPSISDPTRRGADFPILEELSLEENPSEDDVYYFAPWQLSEFNPFLLNWTNLLRPVKSEEVFPAKNQLRTFDGTSFKDVPWNRYKIE